MQYLVYGLRRIPLPRTPVNRGQEEGPEIYHMNYRSPSGNLGLMLARMRRTRRLITTIITNTPITV
jgi:hypothetical protein